MTIRIQLKSDENELTAEQVDLSVEGWVIAEVTTAEVKNRRWIPKENVEHPTESSTLHRLLELVEPPVHVVD